MEIIQTTILLLLFIYSIYSLDKYMSNNREKRFVTIDDNFLSHEECDKLIEMVEPRLKPSTIITNSRSTIDYNTRTSSTAFLKHGENEIVSKIENEICKLFDINKLQLEPLQISKYTSGQQYKYHYDYFNDSNIGQHLGQRHYTALIYLNTVKKSNGGSTKFYYDKSIQPLKGRMIYWSNLNSDLEPDQRTLHAGKPIIGNGCKYIVSIWTRCNVIKID